MMSLAREKARVSRLRSPIVMLPAIALRRMKA
jgi:hypothetical protein